MATAWAIRNDELGEGVDRGGRGVNRGRRDRRREELLTVDRMTIRRNRLTVARVTRLLESANGESRSGGRLTDPPPVDVGAGLRIGEWGVMLRYSEPDELSAGGRAVTMRTKGVLDGRRSTRTPVLIDLRSVPDGGDAAVLRPPSSELPLDERRAAGRVLRAVGHLLDAVALATPLVVAQVVLNQPISISVLLLFALVGTLLLWNTSRRGRLVVVPSEGLVSIIGRVGLAPVVTLIIISLVRMDEVASPGRSIDVLVIVQIVLATIPLILLGRLVSFRLVGLARARGLDLEDTLVLGTGPVGLEVAQALADNPQFGLVPAGSSTASTTSSSPCRSWGDRSTSPRSSSAPASATSSWRSAQRASRSSSGSSDAARTCPVQFYVVPRLFELGISAEDVGHEIDGLPIVPVRRAGSTASLWPAKRAFDVAASLLLLVLTAPLMVASALAVKLTSPGPVFFRQVRIGIGGRPFEILKFRTMRVNDDSTTQWSVDDDDRVTRVGRLLRPSHIDELPQLINVLRGEMSLVGPRPERPHFVEQFGEEIDGYHFRHRVPVGITGWAQVNGYWGDTSIETRVRLDNRYIENWSLWRDLVIGLRTLPTLLGRRR